MESSIANIFLFPMGIFASILSFLQNIFVKELFYFLSVMYFSLDTMFLYFRRPRGWIRYMIHHVMCLIIMYYVKFYCVVIENLMINHFVFELSTPFLNISLERKKNNIDTNMTLVYNLLFVFLFFVTRIIFGTYLFVITCIFVFDNNLSMVLLFAENMIYYMNLIWFYKIIGIVRKKFFV